MPEDYDNGLGFDAFRTGGSTEDAGASSPASESAEPASPVSEAKTETTSAPEDSQESSPAAAAESQPADKPAEEAASAPPEGEKSSSNWDSDDNPYKQEALKLAQRQRDTAGWANEVHKQNLELKRHMERMEKKIDGTYDPEADKEPETPPEEIASHAELQGATRASLYAAYDQHGKEKVDSEVREFDRLFMNNPAIMNRVTRSGRPIQEALKVLGEYRMAQKYGTADFTEIISKVRAEE